MAINVELVITALDRATAPIRSITHALAGIGKSFTQGIGQGIGQAATQALGGLMSQIAEFPRGVIQTAASFESLRTQIEAIEGSTEKAKAAMKWSEDLAKQTTLKLPEVIEAYAMLKSAGIDPVISSIKGGIGPLQALIDVAARSGKGFDQVAGITAQLGQAWGKSKLQLADFRIIMERVPGVLDVFAKKLNKTSAELFDLMEHGKLGRKEIALLIQSMGELGAGASEKFAKSWFGLTSMLSDQWDKFRVQIAEAGFFQGVKDQLQGIVTTLDNMEKSGALGNIAMTISTILNKALEGTLALIKSIWASIVSWATPEGQALSLAEQLMAVFTKLQAVFANFDIQKAISAMQVVASVIVGITSAVKDLGNALVWVADKFGFMLKVGEGVNQMNKSIWETWGKIGKGVGSLFGGSAPASPAAPSAATRSAAAIEGKAAASTTTVGGRVAIDVMSKDGTPARISGIKSANPKVPLTANSGLSMGGF